MTNLISKFSSGVSLFVLFVLISLADCAVLWDQGNQPMNRHKLR
jgi:hypothetical protein